MSGMSGMGQVWRHMRTDRSIAHSKLDRGTVKRVLSFARPHRRLITVFLALTVVDAATCKQLMAVAPPSGVIIDGTPGVSLSADVRLVAYGGRGREGV